MYKAYEIVGNPIIEGEITIQGSKNSALAIICGALLCKGVVVLDNIPRIQDVFELLQILKKINVKFSLIDHQLMLDSSDIQNQPLLFEEIKHFRASYYFIGVFLALFQNVEIYLPGGCKIGKRPIDQHLKGFSQLNIDFNIQNDIFKANSKQILGNEISLTIPSVGATINLILASLLNKNTTIIKNAALEPEIIDFILFLKSMGAKIFGEGSSTIIISPSLNLHSTTYSIMPDRIVSGTYLLYGALLAKKLTLKNFKVKDNEALIHLLINMGANMDIKTNQITIYKMPSFKNAIVKTGVFPEFPTDLQQIITTMLFKGKQLSIVEENIFEDRFLFLKQLQKIGGNYVILNNTVLIFPSSFENGILNCEDLRGGAALLLAAMLAKGTSILKNVNYIERGYENIVEILKNVHVQIKEINLHEA